jgi:hypothetical protein
MALAACTDGPGRPPTFADAAVRPEAGPTDSGPPPDAGFEDAGPRDVPVFVPDSGPLPEYAFSGQFGILNANDPLFAREVQGRLQLVIGGFPFSYLGTISEDGVVDLASAELAASGCPEARITGRYSRTDTTFQLTHTTCNASGEPLRATLTGAYFQDFIPSVSGAYTVEQAVVRDITNCFGLGPVPGEAHWGLSVASDRTVSLFVADDPVGPSVAYFGRATSELTSFDALHHLDADINGTAFAVRAELAQPNAHEPVQLSGSRDVVLPDRGCTISVQFSGVRVAAP